jgi:hypothetical protein
MNGGLATADSGASTPAPTLEAQPTRGNGPRTVCEPMNERVLNVTIVDDHGDPVAADVTVVNEDTRVEHKASSDPSGHARFVLPIGRYEIEVVSRIFLTRRVRVDKSWKNVFRAPCERGVVVRMKCCRLQDLDT